MIEDTFPVRCHLSYMYGYLTGGERGDPYEPDGVRTDTLTMSTEELAKRVRDLLTEERTHADK